MLNCINFSKEGGESEKGKNAVLEHVNKLLYVRGRYGYEFDPRSLPLREGEGEGEGEGGNSLSPS